MEFREVVGRRRSIRFVKPYKPVEKEKIQVMFEAARLASHWGNVQSLRAIAVFKDSTEKELVDSLDNMIIGWQVKIAPVIIFWYLDTDAVDGQTDRLLSLADAGALGLGSKEERKKAVNEIMVPIFADLMELLKLPGMGEVDCGQGIAQATLAAYDMGLGTCCLGPGPKGPAVMEELGVPSHCRLLLIQTVGYPLEHWEAGGQRPRLPFEDLFHINNFGDPYPRSEEVVEELTQDGMFTAPAPLPDRDDELAFMQKALKIKPPGIL